GLAALIKAANPGYSNVDIQKVLMSTSENIDSLNQTQCLGGSCNGFLGAGRINALFALTPQPILNDSLVREAGTNKVFLISNGTKKYVSPFVLSQKYPNTEVSLETGGQLANYRPGPSVLPLDGTLIKDESHPTV